MKINETLKELLLGILAFGVLCQAAGIWFVKDKAGYSLGLWIGTGLALLAAVHMWRSLDRGLELGTDATGYMVKQNMVRYGVLIVAYGVLCVTEIGNPLAAFLGIMGLKAGAYLQPFTHKLLNKRRRR